MLEAHATNVMRGTIVGVDQRPFAGTWTLSASSSRGARLDFEFEASPMFTCKLPEGRWAVEASADGCASSESWVVVDGGTVAPAELRLTLAPTHLIRGRLWSVAHEPLAEFPVSACAEGDGRTRFGLTDGLGDFVIDGLLDGRYMLAFGDAEQPAWHRRTLELRGASIDVGVVEAPPLAEVVVSVVDADGAAVEGAAVQGRGVRGGRIEGSTDERGELAARRVPLGRYLVTASTRERGRIESWVALESSAMNRCTLQLRR